MSKYIKDHSLSIGYNNQGQTFFDLIQKYDRYIHSYYFSLTEGMGGERYNQREVLKSLQESDTYNIPGNILFNTYYSQEHWEALLNAVKDVINLQGVTVLTPTMAKKIKDKYPHLEVHLSVRFWDWNRTVERNDLYNILHNYGDPKDIIDVINISGAGSFNDHELIKYIKDLGIKVKFIANEGCIFNRHLNYSDFPGFEDCKCWGVSEHSRCNLECNKVVEKYPWMDLSRINLFKEFLSIFDYDIIKISTRDKNTDTVFHRLEYWTSDEPTKLIKYHIDISKHYDVFLQWIEQRSKCSGHCFTCRKCKEYYEKFMS